MEIKVKTIEEKDSSWKFLVEIEENGGSTQHEVGLEENYWKELTNGKIMPEELIKKSFEFLLEREKKESILSEFELPLINEYFPEYEEEIKK